MPSVELPNEVVADILSRLAVKDLLRFKCVSNSWYDLISDPYFVKKHLKRSTDSESSANLSLILCESLKYNNLIGVDLNCGVVTGYSPVGIEYCRLYKLFGSCNGLVCLYTYYSDSTVIWNPSTRKSHLLPDIPIEFRGLPLPTNCYSNVTCGIGHDCLSDDYKVIGIVEIYRGGIIMGRETRVYSLKTNSWAKKSRNFLIDEQSKLRCGTYASTSNALHWVIERNGVERNQKQYVIVAFDLGIDDKAYNEVPQPDYESEIFFLTLNLLEGCLCICSSHSAGWMSSLCNIWIMKEYGAKESWTRLISIAWPCKIDWFDHMIPLAYSRSGDRVLLRKYHSRELLWYDLTTKKSTIVELPGLTECLGQVCLQSLVSVNIGGSEVVINKKRQPTSSISRKKEEDTLLDFLFMQDFQFHV